MTRPERERPESAKSKRAVSRVSGEKGGGPAPPDARPPRETEQERAAERARMLEILERARQNVKRIEKRELAGEQVSSELLNLPLR